MKQCNPSPKRLGVALLIPWRWRDLGASVAAETIVVAGVRFMGETAKILSPFEAGADADVRGNVFA